MQEAIQLRHHGYPTSPPRLRRRHRKQRHLKNRRHPGPEGKGVLRLNVEEPKLVDAHQINALIASAIHDCRKDHPVSSIDPEEAKTIAKCVIQQLSDAGFIITPRNEA